MEYSKPKKLPDERYFAKATTSDGSRVFVQLNNVTIASKFSEFDNVVLDLNDTGKVCTIDADNMTAAHENRQEWFGKDMSEKTIAAGYTSGLSGTSLTVQKIKTKGKTITKAYTHDKTLMDPDDLEEDVKCDVVVEYSGMWFGKKSFGPIWRVVQIRTKPPPRKHYTDEYLFENDQASEGSSDEDEFM